MPFCKRLIVPKHVCRSEDRRDGEIFADLVDVCSFTLCNLLRQLSDLSRLSVSILEDLEGELLSICQRSGTLESKVISLQKHVSAFVTRPPLNNTTDLDLESKQPAHFQSSWQQHVNVFSPWNRPECVQELHQEAQVNLHRLLQEFEEQLYDHKVVGQTFRQPSSESSEEASHGRSPLAVPRRPHIVFLPTPKRASDCSTLTTWSVSSASSSPGRSQRSSRGPPVAQKPRWHLRCHTPAHLGAADAGDVCLPERTLTFDLIKGTLSPEPLYLKHLESGVHHFPLRKTFSDLDQSVPQSPERMEQASLLCASSSWNGPKGSTFSPTWSSSFSTFPLAAELLSSEHSAGTVPCNFGDSSGHSVSSGSRTGSLASIPTELSGKARTTPSTDATRGQSGTESSAGSPREKEAGPKRADASRMFRGRSLSTPTDSDSMCSVENQGVEGESSTPQYPSGSSEDGVSTNSVSPSGVDLLPDGSSRFRSRSISLKKPKKKPPPPVRSVSLRNGGTTDGREHPRDSRPKSLVIPREHQLHFQPDFISKPPQQLQDLSKSGGRRAVETRELKREADQSATLNQCKLTNPEKLVSNSSAEQGATVVPNVKVCSSSESLASPPSSQATALSQLSAETESKTSQVKPSGLMSPSSGYSSQCETPTPTIPTSTIMGPSPLGCRMRPKIPQRKSSLPAPSPAERAARCRLSFELPVTTHLDLFSIKPKSRASRRHSDSSAAIRSGYKLSPSQSIMPLVTQMDLRNVRLRSVSRSETDDSVDGSSGILEEEQTCDPSPCATTNVKPKPPVAVKPPLPKRPPNLSLKSPGSSSSSSHTSGCQPSSSAEPHGGDIYTEVRKPKKPPKSPITPGCIPDSGGQLQQRVVEDQQGADRCLQTPSISPEAQGSGGSLPSRVSTPSVAELDKKGNKVPPPIPKKPNIVFVSANTFHASIPTNRPGNSVESCSTPTYQMVSGKQEKHSDSSPRDCDKDADQRAPVSQATSPGDGGTERSSEDSENERSMPGNTDEDSDDVFVQSSRPAATEDLFAIIHRSKRKVLGRKEPSDQFGSKQSLTSPVKGDGDQRATGAALCYNSRNDTFMALLQRKNSKPSGSRGMSAAELLRTTNPLARRVMEFTMADPELAPKPRSSQGK
ncbi:NHS-like protein 2 isoform X1 [Brienomyrus brachyistius]|uniref:NHS-like protein 2 isoform X1 n=1 Tax=Brienomyrus brachyistius TaxID=42636 RepID=UPI0020B41996|nr:NHS-like protein 2 isoform X1 [Brienomyrus brachyistius]